MVGAPMILFAAAAHAVELLNVDPEGPLDHTTVNLGGFVQPRFTFMQPNEEPAIPGELGFSLTRARLEFAADFWKEGGFQVRTMLGVEFMPEARLKDAWVEIGPGGYARLRAGQMKPPTSRTSIVSDTAILFGDRPELADYDHDREIGVMLLSNLGSRNLVELQAGAFDGEGANRLSNVDDTLLYAGRVVVSPFGGPGTVGELLDPDVPATVSIGATGFANMMGDEGVREMYSGLGGELFGHVGPVTAQGEFRMTWVDWEDVNIVDSTAYGGYGQVGCFLTPVPVVGKHLAVIGRFEQLDPYVPASEVPLTGPADDAQERRTIAAGLGVYAGKPLFRTVRDLRAFVYWNFRQENEGQSYDNDGLIVASHFGF